MPDTQFDVVVVGGGPGGYVAAIRAGQLGLKVALVEKENLGGVCLNWGCIPTKALLRNAEVLTLVQESKEYGLTISGLEADWGAAVKRSRQVSERLVKGVGTLMKKNRVQVIEGTAVLRSPKLVEVALKAGGTQQLQTQNVIVASGGRARSVPGVTPDGERVLTYREAVVLDKLPASAIIVGAGPIGMEFAHVWHTYGADITVVEMLPRVLPLEDAEVSTVVERAFTRRKVKVLTSTRVQSVETTANSVRVRVGNEKGDQVLEAELVLIAIGVQPNSDKLGLETARCQARAWERGGG